MNRLSINYPVKKRSANPQRVFFFLVACLWWIEPVYTQSARVGINTSSPLAGLHVADSSVVFTGTLNYNNTNNMPVSGAGTRLLWLPARASFRAGTVSNQQWDYFQHGWNSFAAGLDPVAVGYYSTSIGYQTVTLGEGSVAMGSLNTASGAFAVALGRSTTASGWFSTSMGSNTVASGDLSIAMGSTNAASGSASFASGAFSKALGNVSFVAGYQNVTNSFASFAVGQYSDTTNMVNMGNWSATDPLFIVGNGTSNSQRSNALTILKNGNTGIGTRSPTFRLQVANNNPNDGGYAEGILIENTNVSTGEAAISFRNTSIPANKQWIIGVDQSPKLAFNYGSGFTNSTTHMVLDTSGRMGINTTNPQATLHVVRNSPSGGPFITNPLAIFESNNNSYIQLSSENTDETGILSGNQATVIRSCIVFVADSSIDLRAGGNGTDLKISTEGNVGIGIYTPSAKLHVNGTTKVGVNGTAITEIIKATVNANVPNVGANGGTIAQTFAVTNAALTSSVSVSQDGVLASGLVIASARVSAANTVEVRFVNTTAAAIDPPAMDYHFTIIR